MTADESRQASPSTPNPELGFWAAAYIMLLCSLFGANAVAIKVAFEGFGIFTAAVIRFTLAALVIALWAIFSGRSFRLQKGQWRVLVIYSLLFTV